MAQKFVIEILGELNGDVTKASAYTTNQALKTTLEYAFDTRKKFILPEGDPPFKRDGAPLGMSPANFQMETGRFYVFCRADLQPVRREALFIELLESLHPSEADLLLAVKNQSLGTLFPALTIEALTAAGLLNVPEEFLAEPPKSEKRGRGRPPGAKNKPKEENGEVAS